MPKYRPGDRIRYRFTTDDGRVLEEQFGTVVPCDSDDSHANFPCVHWQPDGRARRDPWTPWLNLTMSEQYLTLLTPRSCTCGLEHQ